MTEGEARRQVARGASRATVERARRQRRTTPLLADREQRAVEVEPATGPERSSGPRPAQQTEQQAARKAGQRRVQKAPRTSEPAPRPVADPASDEAASGSPEPQHLTAVEPVPALAEPVPVSAEPVPVSAEPVPVSAEPVPVSAEPVPGGDGGRDGTPAGAAASTPEPATRAPRTTGQRASAAQARRPARVRRLVAVTDRDRTAARELLAAAEEAAAHGGPGRGTGGADGPGDAGDADDADDGLEQRLAAVLAFVRRRLTGDITVDEFGFDEELTDVVLLNLLRPLYRSWFRVEVRGIENIPSTGGALIVANHSGAIAFDALMTQVAVHDEHPAHRHLRLLGADLVFSTPVLGELARKGGATLASNADAERLLGNGELVAVWPEGFKGIGKPFSERYKLQRFGRGGFVSAALKTGTPIVPCAIVGAEETYPILGNMPSLARILGLPYAPITPTWPLLGLLGLIPLPSKWLIEFCPPVAFDDTGTGSAAAEDPMTVFDLTDLVRQTIQQALYSLLVQRRSIFF